MEEDKIRREAKRKIAQLSLKLYAASGVLGVTGGALLGVRTEEFNSIPLAVVVWMISILLFVISNTIMSNREEFYKEAEKTIREKLEDEDENIKGT